MDYRITVGQLTWWQCCNGWIQALEKKQAGKVRNMDGFQSVQSVGCNTHGFAWNK